MPRHYEPPVVGGGGSAHIMSLDEAREHYSLVGGIDPVQPNLRPGGFKDDDRVFPSAWDKTRTKKRQSDGSGKEPKKILPNHATTMKLAGFDPYAKPVDKKGVARFRVSDGNGLFWLYTVGDYHFPRFIVPIHPKKSIKTLGERRKKRRAAK